MASTTPELGYLKSKFPVLFPSHPALTLASEEYLEFVKKDLKQDSSEVRSKYASTQASYDNVTKKVDALQMGSTEASADTKSYASAAVTDVSKAPFIRGLLNFGTSEPVDMQDKMLTENGDLAYSTTSDSLVDLFSELEEVVSGPRLAELLNAAWQADSLATLKIIFNSRSIHLGKSSRIVFYRCAGWLAQEHPLTLLLNLQWLSRPLIEKKAENKEIGEDDMVLVEGDKADDDPTRFDVRNGVAHGYWKDLLNILALAANNQLNVLANPRDVLNIARQAAGKRVWDQTTAESGRHEVRADRHATTLKLFAENSFYCHLHITVARLFADQLIADLKLLRSENKSAQRQISLCAKWAPSSKLFHDKHTFIVSTIAEILHPESEYPSITERELYLRHAREAYRKDIASLRKALEVVERDVTAQTFSNIRYDRVPSFAMNKHAPTFAKKDSERFEKYIDNVATGKARISGATLMPAKLIKIAREGSHGSAFEGRKKETKVSAKNMVEQKLEEMAGKVIDGQWKTLVQRIKDSGTLENSIAVCDVSGSMGGPVFPDGTCPMDSSIGLALLLAQVTKPPFGNAFITFSATPKIIKIDPKKSLREQVQEMERSDWGTNTDFIAVFEKLILPMARKNKLKQDDMVKRIFVFSDMQFDSATLSKGKGKWSSSYQRVKDQYALYGYEMPELVFWNLAGGRGGYPYSSNASGTDAVAPKPVQAGEQGVSLVSGYSQAMLKVFLDNGSFEELEESEEIVEKDEENQMTDKEEDQITIVEKRRKIDPLLTVKKAIGHKAYSMLAVHD